MEREVWIGFVELRQLPGDDHAITLSGKGAFTWITCWASDAESFSQKVSEVMREYRLFVVEVEQAMPYSNAEEQGLVTDEIFEQYQRTSANSEFCIFGTFHSYKSDN